MPLEPWNDQQTPAKGILARGNQILQDAPARFTVQSQSHPGNSYTVVVETQRQACQCAFHVESGRECIHILAVRYWLEIQSKTATGTTTERVRLTYKQAWTAYNAAQASEVRGPPEPLPAPAALDEGDGNRWLALGSKLLI